jgi:hypothetical protein
MSVIAEEELSDHTAVMQAALDELHVQGGGKLTIRAGRYFIGDVKCPSGVRVQGEPGATIVPADGTIGFIVDYTTGVRFEGLRFDGSLQRRGTCIGGTGAMDIEIERCRFEDGFLGVHLTDVKRGAVRDCRGSRFRRWPFLVTGCDGFEYTGNDSRDNDYDGLKLAGVNLPQPPNLIKDVRVSGNVCCGNKRDGFDLAGNDVENVQIYGNLFRDNSLQGIDVKTVYQSGYMRRVLVHDNQCLYNGHGQLHCQNAIGAASAVRVYDNELAGDPAAASYGIRFAGQGCGSVVARNAISGVGYGIRLIDSDEADVRSNLIECSGEGILIELQGRTAMAGNVIADNDIRSEAGSCILVASEGIACSTIRNNRLQASAGRLRIDDGGTGTILFRNEAGIVTEEPSGWATEGDIFWNGKPQPGGPSGWITVTTGKHSVFKPFGFIGE